MAFFLSLVIRTTSPGTNNGVGNCTMQNDYVLVNCFEQECIHKLLIKSVYKYIKKKNKLKVNRDGKG